MCLPCAFPLPKWTGQVLDPGQYALLHERSAPVNWRELRCDRREISISPWNVAVISDFIPSTPYASINAHRFLWGVCLSTLRIRWSRGAHKTRGTGLEKQKIIFFVFIFHLADFVWNVVREGRWQILRWERAMRYLSISCLGDIKGSAISLIPYMFMVIPNGL